MKGNVIVGQSGGPTAVINSSLAGVFKTAKERGFNKVYGMRNGIQGFLDEQYIDLSDHIKNELDLELLKRTPSAFLGTCRYKLPDIHEDKAVYERIFELLNKLEIEVFIYIGGNDSMDTIKKLTDYSMLTGAKQKFVGCPKTIDNDLAMTDHTPGFGSAAKYIATSCMEVSKDARVYSTGMITVIEIMGRHAGWLAGSAALASCFGSGPDLIYLPEIDFDMEEFAATVIDLYNKNKKVLIAVSEGIHDKDGKLIAEYGVSGGTGKDAFGHTQLGGLAVKLADELKRRTGAKVRGIELSLLQRCGAHLASATDLSEAFNAGKVAVESAVAGETGKMVAFVREYVDGQYTCGTQLLPLEKVANYEKKVPVEWITKDGSNVTKEFIDYVLPLIQGEPERVTECSLPRYAKLKKVKV